MKYFSWKNHNLNIEIPNDAACIKSISVPILLSNIPIDYGIASIQVLKLTLSINLNLIFQHFLFAPRSFHIQSMLPWLWKNLSDERKNIQRILMSGPEMEIRPRVGAVDAWPGRLNCISVSRQETCDACCLNKWKILPDVWYFVARPR